MVEPLFKITILVPSITAPYLRGIHAQTPETSKVNFYLNEYQTRLVKQACAHLDNIAMRKFIRHIVVRAAAEIIHHYEGNRPPTGLD